MKPESDGGWVKRLMQSEADGARMVAKVTPPPAPEPTPPPAPLGEFSAPDFSFEPVVGARSFDVDNLGRLTGVTYKDVWTPGENVSHCYAPRPVAYGSADLDSLRTQLAAINYTISWTFGGASAPREPRTDEHPMTSCKCGFYGYYDGSNDYGKPARVSGVVEGYGEVVVGTRGFRATKARIVALTIEADVPTHLATRVRHNYRDVPFYDLFEDMVEAHPVTVERGITPESDPDFWTRSVG
jgi:hypothetical protein